MPRSRSFLVIAATLTAVTGLVPAASTSASPLPVVAPAHVAQTALSPIATLRLSAVRVSSGLVNPVLVRSANDGTSRLFVVEQAGRVRSVVGSKVTGTYLDLRGIVTSGGERGLLGLAFPKDFATSHLLWVSYTRSDGALVIARFQARSATSSSVLLSTRRTVMVIPHPVNANHNGGNIDFGADGYLYIGTGDGGSAGDPPNNAQSLRSLLGKMLRVNVRCAAGPTYCIPPSNPYATSKTARHEIWMYGLRNPWRWSFDTNGTQWIGDVGQDRYEEIDAIPAAGAKRRNLGWSCREGRHVYDAGRCRAATTYTAPVMELCHPSVSGCAPSRAGEAIIGGYVYRGASSPSAVGTYVFGDYVTGKIWPYRSGVLGVPTVLAGVSGFGIQDNREIYAVTLDGGLYRIGFRAV